MEILASCGSCGLDQRLTLSPVTRLMVCQPCQQLIEVDDSHYRTLEVPTCPNCGGNNVSNIQRFGAPLCRLVGVDRCCCPACHHNQLQIDAVTLICWDEELVPRWQPGEIIHCRVIAPQRGVSSRCRTVQLLDCPVDCLNCWGEAQLIDHRSAVWLGKFTGLSSEALHLLQFNIDDVPWLRIDLDQMRTAVNSGAFPCGWYSLVEPRINLLTLPELKQALDQGGLVCSLNLWDVGDLVKVLQASGRQACPILAMWSSTEKAWKDWNQCQILVDTGDSYYPLFGAESIEQQEQPFHRLLWNGPGFGDELVFPPTSMQLWATLQLDNRLEKPDYKLFDLAGDIYRALIRPPEVTGAETLLRLAQLLPTDCDRIGAYARGELLGKAAKLAVEGSSQ